MTHVANEVMIGLVLGFGFVASLVAIAGPPAAQQQPAEQAQESPVRGSTDAPASVRTTVDGRGKGEVYCSR